MPELPEVESVRRTLLPRVVGRSVTAVQVRRREVVTGPAQPRHLLRGCTITAIRRHGKQLVLIADPAAAVVCVHLGMTGSLCWHQGNGDAQSRARKAKQSSQRAEPSSLDRHHHVLWRLDDGSMFTFRDPRRFGGIWTFPSWSSLVQARWQALGPDALTISTRDLGRALARTQRGLKAALLDQHVAAGLGNIYVDEVLHACRLHPLTRADTLARGDVARLARQIRATLRRAIAAGGSTLRDFTDGRGAPGKYQRRHLAYGRAGQPCLSCGATLRFTRVSARATVFCPTCQPTAATVETVRA